MGRRYFRELVTPFLRRKLEELESGAGVDSPAFQALARQYLRTDSEDAATDEDNLRHYDAEVKPAAGAAPAPGGDDARAIPGVERLYRRTLVIEPTLACVAHCRYCIRANYPRHNLNNDQLERVARFCGSAANRDDLTEVLVTGGDVLLVPDRVDALIDALARHAPNIRVVRIATRIPVQDPARIDDDLLRLFRPRGGLRFELATQVNHAVEFFPEVIAAYGRIMDRGVRVYAQNVLLRGVNDTLPALVDLYHAIRTHGLESHYLFHCVPLAGMAHLRTSLREALDLACGLSACGEISGRAKPMLAAMTDIGKIVLYDGTVLDRRGRHVLLQSRYRMDERLRWNPGWELPRSAAVDSRGHLRIWYLDGTEAAKHEPETGSIHRVVRTLRPDGPWRVSLPVLTEEPAATP